MYLLGILCFTLKYFMVKYYQGVIMNVLETIKAFDLFLEKEGLTFEATIIGGAALNVMNIISRETIDVDCLLPRIPENILNAAAKFRLQNPELGLMKKWLNNGPESLIRDLNQGWEDRCQDIFKGKAIHFKTLGRLDLIKSKMFAYCDRQTDLQDCIALNPNNEELKEALSWVKDRDANPEWPTYVEKQFSFFKEKLKLHENE
jgi:hypothetical protein